MQTLGLTTEQVIDVISVYSSAEASIIAVDTEPGWKKIGAFPMPANASVRLDMIGSVSDGALTLTVRLYCISPGFEGEVLGSRVSLANTIESQAFSGAFALVGGRLYQVHAQVVGGSGDAFFGNVSRVTPTGV